jgi:hypothetical protein
MGKMAPAFNGYFIQREMVANKENVAKKTIMVKYGTPNE